MRINANLARSYYMEVASDGNAAQAVCLVPGHAQPGQTIDLDTLPLTLTISEPVEFSLWISSTRLTDDPAAPYILSTAALIASRDCDRIDFA